MNGDPRQNPGEPHAAGPGASGPPSEEELRAAYEAELSRFTSSDMILQAAVSLLNIGGRRLGAGAAGAPAGAPGDGEDAGAASEGRDLEQVRDAIDAVSALLGILERRIPRELRPLRDALSQLQIAYARAAQADGGAPRAGGEAPGPGEAERGNREPGAPPGTPGAHSGSTDQPGQPPGDEQSERPGPAESSGRLWVPGR